MTFTVAHVAKREPHLPYVRVYRSWRHRSLNKALDKAGQIRRAGYLTWIERTGALATR